MDIGEILEILSKTPGVSGYEGAVALMLEQHPGVEARRDALGNLIALKRGEAPEPRPRLMLAAHMDEIGLMVTKLEEGGFLRFTSVGGIDPRVLPGQRVLVHGRRAVPGVIGFLPPHLADPGKDRDTVPMHELYIDTGGDQDGLDVGDVCTFEGAFRRMGQRFSGKALDDRAGVAVLLKCLEGLARVRHEADVFLVATVQEEVGLRGAMTGTYGIVPDVGIALDVTHGLAPGLPEYDTYELGKGPVLSTGANIHPGVFGLLRDVAESEGVPYQVEAVPGATGTDAWAMQISRAGVPTGLVSIPLRYMHTPVEILDAGDLSLTARLLVRFASRVDRAFLEGLSWN